MTKKSDQTPEPEVKETGMVLAYESSIALDEKKRKYVQVPIDLAPSGAEALQDSIQIRLPNLRILQPLSKAVTDGTVEGAKAGLMYNSLTGELDDKIAFIPLHFRKMRFYYDQDNRTDLLCLSVDGFGKTGVPRRPPEELGIPVRKINDRQGDPMEVGDCLSCPHSKFTKGRNGENVRPACNMVDMMYGVYLHGFPKTKEEVDDYLNRLMETDTAMEILGNLWVMPVKGTGIRALSDILNASTFLGGVYMQAWTLTTKKNTGQVGTWYTPNFTPAGRLDELQKLVANSLRLLCSSLNPSLNVDELEELSSMDGAGVPAPAGAPVSDEVRNDAPDIE